MGRRDSNVGPKHQQGPHPTVGAQLVEHLVRRGAGPRQAVRVDSPDRGDVRAGLGIVEASVAGQLVGLLAVLATALPIALPGQGGEPTTRASGQTQSQRQVNEGQRGVGAVAVLLGAACGEHHGR